MMRDGWNLTPRQCDVIQELGKGKSNKVIGKTLYITEHTVKAHLSEVYREFGVTNRTEAVIYAKQKGIIPR